MEFTKEGFRALRVDIDAALAEVAKKHGLRELRGAGMLRYDPAGTFSLKLEGVNAGGLDKDAARYKNEQKSLGLPDLGTEFRQGGKTFATCGLTSGGKVVGENKADHKKYVFDRDIVVALVKAQGGVK